MNAATAVDPEKKVLVNGLHPPAVENIQKKMREDPSMGAEAPLMVSAAWHNGMVRLVTPTPSDDFAYLCYPPPELLVTLPPQLPNLFSYCPGPVAGCFALTLCTLASVATVMKEPAQVKQAVDSTLQLESLQATVETTLDMTHFYRVPASMGPLPDDDTVLLPPPTANQVDMTLTLALDSSTVADDSLPLQNKKALLQELVQQAHLCCPATEILERPLQASWTVERLEPAASTTSPPPVSSYYNMARYSELAAGSDPIQEKVKAVGTWYCHDECTEYPHSLMQLVYQGQSVPLSQEAPVASGAYPNPMQICLYGHLATVMQTLAVRLAAAPEQSVVLRSLTGTARTVLNKRRMMAVETEGPIFTTGAVHLSLQVDTDASEAVWERAVQEMRVMAPNLGLMQHRVPLHVQIRFL